MRKNEHHEALTKGEMYYFTGKPCKNGHISFRYTSSKGCISCHSEKNYAQVRTEKAKIYANNYRKQNKEKIHNFRKEWLEKNPGKSIVYIAKRRSAKLLRTPKWLNSGHFFEIESVYKYCDSLRKIGLNYEVDHIVPLRGKFVSGLNVPWNLQVISMTDNRSKGNKHYE